MAQARWRCAAMPTPPPPWCGATRLWCISASPAHRLRLRDVLRGRPVVQAQFHRPPARLTRLGCILRAPLAGARLDATGVGGHALPVRAPEPEERLTDRLADDVPEGDLRAP